MDFCDIRRRNGAMRPNQEPPRGLGQVATNSVTSTSRKRGGLCALSVNSGPVNFFSAGSLCAHSSRAQESCQYILSTVETENTYTLMHYSIIYRPIHE